MKYVNTVREKKKEEGSDKVENSGERSKEETREARREKEQRKKEQTLTQLKDIGFEPKVQENMREL